MSEFQATKKEGSGGVTWSGSIVGSTNPDQKYGYQNKRTSSEIDDLPSSVVVQFSSSSDDNNPDIPPIDVPVGTTTAQLEALLHSLLETKEKQPYAFYISSPDLERTEITSDLSSTILATKISTESTLAITYEPLAVFRVRPVTRCTATMPGHTDAILHVSFSPSGRTLASGGGDTTVRFWDTNTCLPQRTCTGHRNHVLATSYSPTGLRFASADKNGVLIIWDPVEGTMMGQPIKAHGKWITAIAWEPLHRNRDGERVATASKDGTAKVWNVRTRRMEYTLSGHLDSVEGLRWGGEGFIYTGSRDRTVKVWGAESDGDRRAGVLVRTLVGHGHRVNVLACSSDYINRTGGYDQYGKVAADPYAAAVAKYAEFKKHNPKEIIVSGSDDFTLIVWSPTEGKQPLKRLTGHVQAVNDVKFSPSGRHFASASFDKKVKIWDGRSGNFVSTLTGHVGAVYCVAWSGDSRYLVSGSKDSTLKLWDIESGGKASGRGGRACKETLPGHADEVYALDWSPDGRGVASGSKDRTVKIWRH